MGSHCPINLSNKTDFLSKVRMNEKDKDEDKLIKQVLDNSTLFRRVRIRGMCLKHAMSH